MTSGSPAAGAAGAKRLVDGIGGDRALSVGTLGAGNGGSFVSGLSAFGNGGAAEEEDEEDHQAVFAKIFEEVRAGVAVGACLVCLSFGLGCVCVCVCVCFFFFGGVLFVGVVGFVPTC